MNMNGPIHTNIASDNVRMIAWSAMGSGFVANQILHVAPWKSMDAPRAVQRLVAVAIVCLCTLCVWSSNSAADQSSSIGQSGSDFIIGISPFLEKSVKDEVYRSLV